MPNAKVSPTRRILATLLTVGAVLAALPALGALLLGLSPRLQLTSRLTVLLASFVHYGIIAWAIAFVLAALAALAVRHKSRAVLALLLAAGLGWQLSWIAPYYRADPAPHAKPLSVAAINIEDGGADLDQLVAATDHADVIVLTEITDDARAGLAARSLGRTHPYQAHRQSGVPGTSIYSRLPIDELGFGDTTFASLLVRVHHESGPILVMGVHPMNPMGPVGAANWLSDAAALRAFIRPHLNERLVVAGDFNAIDRQATMRPLLAEDGLRSTAELAGTGIDRTWPVRGPGSALGPLIGIDHILVSPSMTAASHHTFRIDNTDHLGLFAEVAART